MAIRPPPTVSSVEIPHFVCDYEVHQFVEPDRLDPGRQPLLEAATVDVPLHRVNGPAGVLQPGDVQEDAVLDKHHDGLIVLRRERQGAAAGKLVYQVHVAQSRTSFRPARSRWSGPRAEPGPAPGP